MVVEIIGLDRSERIMMRRYGPGMGGVDRLVAAGLFAVASKGQKVVLTSDPLVRRLAEIKDSKSRTQIPKEERAG
jgi:hypothetical protein